MEVNTLHFNTHFLAHHLGRSISDIDNMLLSEYYEWLEYFSILNGTEKEKPKESNIDLVSFLRSKKG